MRKKWTAVETAWDIYSMYTLCWGGIWLLGMYVVLAFRGNVLLAPYILKFAATLAFLISGIILAIVLGLFFAGFYLSAMRLTAILWRSNKLQRNIYSNGIAILLCFLQLYMIEAVLGQQRNVVEIPFALANIIAGLITVRFLPKHAWFTSEHSA